MMMGIRYYYTTALLLSIGKRKDIYLREQDIYIYIYIYYLLAWRSVLEKYKR